jgi:hypothetical protein
MSIHSIGDVMLKHYTLIYSRGEPGVPLGLFEEELKRKGSIFETDTEFHVWVDNDDHTTAKEFYSFRKYIRKGLKIKLYINPPELYRNVFDFLISQLGPNIQINGHAPGVTYLSESA